VTSPILPGAAIGVLGSGQLGRMFAIAARRMGYRVHTLSPDDDTPTGQVADLEIVAAYDDLDAIRSFAQGVEAVTFEFENVPAATAAAAAEFAPVRPKGEVLHVTQHRLREKRFLQSASIPVAPFAEVSTTQDLAMAADAVGLPGVLKTAGWGYDGKGQARVKSLAEMEAAWAGLNRQPAVLEAWIDFAGEVSVVAARGFGGEFKAYPVAANLHEQHILDVSSSPADLPATVSAEAVEIARAILERLDVVGVLCVEFFLTTGGKLLVNELAPRPHNSGHLTFDACVTSQFEQQLRAICGLPLGSTELWRPAAMANLLGDLWADGEPDWPALCAHDDVKLHLYGKTQARPGRKMGHLTALAATPAEAVDKVIRARRSLTRAGAAAPAFPTSVI
jgi:5-(carboxyamino)imidazole ribonucleotide synthase